MLSTVMFLTGDIRTLRTARHKERSATPTTTNLFFKVINTHFLFTKCYLRSHQRNKLHWLQDETYFPSFIIKLSIYLLRKLYVQQSLSLKNELGFWNNVRCASKVLGRIRLGLLPTLLAGMERFQKTGLLVINIIKLKSFSTIPQPSSPVSTINIYSGGGIFRLLSHLTLVIMEKYDQPNFIGITRNPKGNLCQFL